MTEDVIKMIFEDNGGDTDKAMCTLIEMLPSEDPNPEL